MCLVLFVVVFSAIVEFSWIMFNQLQLADATIKAARIGAIGGGSSEIVAALGQTVMAGPITTPVITVVSPGGLSVADSDRTTGSVLSVSTRLSYDFISPLGGLLETIVAPDLAANCTTRVVQ